MEQNKFSPTDNQSSDGQAVPLKDRAREIASTAQGKLADVGSTVRDRAENLKDSLADALESGADRLRARSGADHTDLAGVTRGVGSIAIDRSDRVSHVGEKVAGRMDATADWLRDADFDGLKSGIEKQVKEHPGRTLLIAVGLGYLIGKALRK